MKSERGETSEYPRGAAKWSFVPAPRLSFNLRLIPDVTMMFPEGDLAQRLATARRHGFRGVEGGPPDNLREMRRLLDAEGMHFVCMSAGRGSKGSDALGMGAVAGREAAFRDAILEAIEAASFLSCPMIHATGGLVPPEQRRECETIYLENLHFSCEQARTAGVQVLIEPICAARQPLYVVHTHAEASEIIKKVGADNLGLMADTYHGRMSQEVMLDIVRNNAERIPLLQVAEAPARKPPVDDDEELRNIFAFLAAENWQGWISGEYVMAEAPAESLAWTRQLDCLRV